MFDNPALEWLVRDPLLLAVWRDGRTTVGVTSAGKSLVIGTRRRTCSEAFSRSLKTHATVPPGSLILNQSSYLPSRSTCVPASAPATLGYFESGPLRRLTAFSEICPTVAGFASGTVSATN